MLVRNIWATLALAGGALAAVYQDRPVYPRAVNETESARTAPRPGSEGPVEVVPQTVPKHTDGDICLTIKYQGFTDKCCSSLCPPKQCPPPPQCHPQVSTTTKYIYSTTTKTTTTTSISTTTSVSTKKETTTTVKYSTKTETTTATATSTKTTTATATSTTTKTVYKTDTDTVTRTNTQTQKTTEKTTTTTTRTFTDTYTYTTIIPTTVVSDRTSYITTTIVTTSIRISEIPVTNTVTATVTGPGATVTAPGATGTTTTTVLVTTSTTILVPTTLTTVSVTTLTVPLTVVGTSTVFTTIISSFTVVQTTSVPIVVATTFTVTDTSTVTQTLLLDVTACPAPTNTVPPPQPFNFKDNRTWGCLPGYVCSPPKPAGCNLWADSPANDFLCKPADCIVAPPFNKGNWAPNTTNYFPPSEGYFNLDPRAFGLSFDIFEKSTAVVTKHGSKDVTVSTGNWASQTSITHYPPESTEIIKTHPPATTKGSGHNYRRFALWGGEPAAHMLNKRDETITPAVCYGICNDAYLEVQSTGKSEGICAPGSAFQEASTGCDACIVANAPNSQLTSRSYVDPKFEQFKAYCVGRDPLPVVTPPTSVAPPPAPIQSTPPPPVVTSAQAPPNTPAPPVVVTPSTTPSPEPPAPTTPTTPPVDSTTTPSTTPPAIPSTTPSTTPPPDTTSTRASTSTSRPPASVSQAAAGRLMAPPASAQRSGFLGLCIALLGVFLV